MCSRLRGDFQREEKLRQEALKTWSTNPKVDHLIGRKLSISTDLKKVRRINEGHWSSFATSPQNSNSRDLRLGKTNRLGLAKQV